MKQFFYFIIFLLPTITVMAEDKVVVKVTSVDVNRGGNLIILVFGNNGFPIQHKEALVTQTINVSKETMMVTFPIPQKKELAIKVLHDEDLNNRVTKDWTGIWPHEGLGFSNGKSMGMFGPPSFMQAKISRESALTGVDLNIVYP